MNSTIIILGVTENYKRGLRKIPYGYIDVIPEKDGWIDAKKYIPKKYDMCFLKTPIRVIKGWHNGLGWDGLRVRDNDSILYWKKIGDKKF